MASEIVQIFNAVLGPHLTFDGVFSYPSNGLTTYVVTLHDYSLEIRYDFIDNFYTAKLEERKNNQIGEIVLLSQSKRFHKDLKTELQKNKLTKKDFQSHMFCLGQMIRAQLDTQDNFDRYKIKYPSDRKFDGIFLK